MTKAAVPIQEVPQYYAPPLPQQSSQLRYTSQGGSSYSRSAGPQGGNDQECYCCEKKGHTTRFCPDMQKLINSGLIHYGNNNRLHFGDNKNPGDELPRLPNRNRLPTILNILGIKNEEASVSQPGSNHITLSSSLASVAEDSDGEVWYGTVDHAINALRTNQKPSRLYNQTQGDDTRVTKPQHLRKNFPRLKTNRTGEYIVDKSDESHTQVLLKETIDTSIPDYNTTKATNKGFRGPDDTEKAPRTKRLTEVLSKGDRKAALIRVLNRYLNTEISISLKEAIDLMLDVRKLFG